MPSRSGAVDTATQKARRAADPEEIPAGRYTVILEPAAVAGLFGPLLWSFDARSYERGTSALSGKLRHAVMDERLTLRNHPEHPELRGVGFDGAGLPTDARVWIRNGVLRQLHYDRFTAKKNEVAADDVPMTPPTWRGMRPRQAVSRTSSPAPSAGSWSRTSGTSAPSIRRT